LSICGGSHRSAGGGGEGRGERQVEGQRAGRCRILRQLTSIFAGASSCEARRRIGCRQWEEEDGKTLVVCSLSSRCVSSPRHAGFAYTRSQGLAAARHPVVVRMVHLGHAACTWLPARLLCTQRINRGERGSGSTPTARAPPPVIVVGWRGAAGIASSCQFARQ